MAFLGSGWAGCAGFEGDKDRGGMWEEKKVVGQPSCLGVVVAVVVVVVVEEETARRRPAEAAAAATAGWRRVNDGFSRSGG